MARVVVVGGGYAGLASAARLARLAHDVTLLDRAPALGGALRSVRSGDWCWDGAVTSMLLPAVARDLFRKSGRPLEAELTLEPLTVLREHRWPDGSAVALPGGSRLGQRAAVESLGAGLGDVWLAHVGSYAPVWDVLRRGYLEPAWDADVGARPDLDRAVARVLDSRTTLHRRLRRSLGRSAQGRLLADVAAHPLVAAGQDLRSVPAWAGVLAFLEQCFGGWRFPGGSQQLSDALGRRLVTRGVRAELGVDVVDVVVRAGRAVGVRTDQGTVDADAVVCAVDPRRLPALARHASRAPAAPLPHVTHLGLALEAGRGDDDAGGADADHELVLHGGPPLWVRPGVAAPPGGRACTVLSRGPAGRDALDELARRGLDVRERVLLRVDRTPSELWEQWGGSPLGVRWRGPRTARRLLGPRTPVAGVYAAGAHSSPAAGLPFVGLSAARAVEALEQDEALRRAR